MTTLSSLSSKGIQASVTAATSNAKTIKALDAAQNNYERLHNIYIQAKLDLEALCNSADRPATYPSVTKKIGNLHTELERIRDILRPHFATLPPVERRRTTRSMAAEVAPAPIPSTPKAVAPQVVPSTGKRKREETPEKTESTPKAALSTGKREEEVMPPPQFEDDIGASATITPRRSPRWQRESRGCV